MSCLHPPRPNQSSLATRPAFVTVLLLCNFASSLKIDRRLEQTLFGVGKQQNSYKKCLWSRRKFTRETTTKWDITTAPCWPSVLRFSHFQVAVYDMSLQNGGFGHSSSLKGPFLGLTKTGSMNSTKTNLYHAPVESSQPTKPAYLNSHPRMHPFSDPSL